MSVIENMTAAQIEEFALLVSKRLVPGHSIVDKFGVNPLITSTTNPEDIWEYGGAYTYTVSTGVTYYMSSSNNADTQLCSFQVLTVDGTDWVYEEFTQNIAGQTKTALTPPSGNPIVRIFRIENEDTSDIAGSLYVYEDDTTVDVPGVPDTPAKVRAMIDGDNNQTLMAVYTIPSGYVGFLYRGEFGLSFEGGPSATETANIDYRSRRFGGAFKTKKLVSLITTGQSMYADPRTFPDIIPAKTDITLRGRTVSADMGVWAAFDILLVEEEYLSDSLREALGQD